MLFLVTCTEGDDMETFLISDLMITALLKKKTTKQIQPLSDTIVREPSSELHLSACLLSPQAGAPQGVL